MREYGYSLDLPHSAGRVWAIMQDYDRWHLFAGPMVTGIRVLEHGDKDGNGLVRCVNYKLPLGFKGESIETISQIVAKNDIMEEAFERCVKHLKANDVDLKSDPLTIGPALTFDRKREEFTGEFGQMANMYLRRNYREPFIVPDRV